MRRPEGKSRRTKATANSRNKEKKFLAKVLFFDENLGKGLLLVLGDNRRIFVTHREIEGEGFKILFEGEIVEVSERNGEIRVRRLEDEHSI